MLYKNFLKINKSQKNVLGECNSLQERSHITYFVMSPFPCIHPTYFEKVPQTNQIFLFYQAFLVGIQFFVTGKCSYNILVRAVPWINL